MRLVIFGLSVSSSWGNGHATLWRALIREFSARGHRVTFFERDVSYYRNHRDLNELESGRLILYTDWDSVAAQARREARDADAVMVTSYCPDAFEATDLAVSSPGLSVFYDLDAPVTIDRLLRGEPVEYVGPRGYRDFDLVLSYTGGGALDALRSELGAVCVEPLYGSVDPQIHHPVPPQEQYRCDVSYLGTYAQDRQPVLESLLLEPARRLPGQRFRIGGSMYPTDFPWTENIHFSRHVPPPEHAAFYCSSRITVNVTRDAMARLGYCPSGRLFEAASCGVPILSDFWPGLDHFFEPGREILIAGSSEEAIEAIDSADSRLNEIARAARERTLAEHTAARRALELEQILERAASNARSTELREAV